MIDYCDHITGVFGHPVSENPGVVIMDAAYRSIGAKNWRFLTIDIEPNALGDAVRSIRTMNMRGMNLTIPHKIEAMKYLDEISKEAELIGAVNTVVNENGKLIGYNTDGKGFMISLKNNHIDVHEKNIVMLGSGGVARAMGTELCLAGVKKLTIISIEEIPAAELANKLNGLGECAVVYEPWQRKHTIPEDTDILVNATPLGLFPNVDRLPDIDYDSVEKSVFVQDVIPNPAKTAFIEKMTERGLKCGTGMGMMIAQAALNTELWTGKLPNEKLMTEAFLKAIGG